MVGDQDQVGGQALRSAAQGPGQVAGQGGVEPAVQLGEVGQGGDQGQRAASSEGASRKHLQASESEVMRAAA